MDTTILKGLSLVEALAASGEPCGVTELSKQLDLTKSNVHRLLQTLAARGYVRNCAGSGRYELTPKIWELGVAVIGRLDVKQIAREYMEHLAKFSGETVHLSILDRDEVVYVDKVDSPQPVGAYSRVGGRAPAYCVATGKAMLAFAPSEVVDAISLKLKAYTPQTLVSPTELKAELARVRDAGYAINKGEWREGVCGVAAPIRDARNNIIAAIGISGPMERFKPRIVKQVAPTVVSVAQKIAARLGYSAEREGQVHAKPAG